MVLGFRGGAVLALVLALASVVSARKIMDAGDGHERGHSYEGSGCKKRCYTTSEEQCHKEPRQECTETPGECYSSPEKKCWTEYKQECWDENVCKDVPYPKCGYKQVCHNIVEQDCGYKPSQECWGVWGVDCRFQNLVRVCKKVPRRQCKTEQKYVCSPKLVKKCDWVKECQHLHKKECRKEKKCKSIPYERCTTVHNMHCKPKTKVCHTVYDSKCEHKEVLKCTGCDHYG